MGADGDYWHNYPNGTHKDKKQNTFIKNNGWDIIRFWERDINNDINKCRKIIQDKITLYNTSNFSYDGKSCSKNTTAFTL